MGTPNPNFGSPFLAAFFWHLIVPESDHPLECRALQPEFPFYSNGQQYVQPIRETLAYAANDV